MLVYFRGRIFVGKDKEVLSKSFLKLVFFIKFSGFILIVLNLIWGLRFYFGDVLRFVEIKFIG